LTKLFGTRSHIRVRTFSYREAAILLGGKQSKLVTALDKATGGIMLGAATAVSEVLSWFDAKADFVRLSHDLVNAVVESKRGIRRFDRTQRIEAAHTVIVMTAFFEALADFDLPFSSGDLVLTPEEQRYIGGSATHSQISVGDWLRDPDLLPTPDRPYESNVGCISRRYVAMCNGLFGFVVGLSIWDQLDESRREKVTAQLRVLPDKALRGYQDMFRTLVAEFPEAACWVNMTDHAATRHEVRALGAGLAGLEKILDEIRAGSEPDDRRAALARAYRAQLREPVLPPGEVSHQFAIPTMERSYVNPRFRVSAVGPDSKPSQESWWDELPKRDDIQQYLAGYLTSSQAATAPLVVLGQPGAGKSMLTKVLAARLPATDFLPIRVELRDVPAEADIQDQIEHAIRRATGDRVEWTVLARSAGDAVPVILLDGFDELLQATGAHHIDYLTKVSQFQKREADQGRELAVIVTTRIAVAGLARFPEESIALRLEPFDEEQVELWVGIWNSENRGYFAQSGVAPLKLEAVLEYPELATQPLLLLMLALYDADKNALQGAEGAISQGDLYERLLVQFARREVVKANRGYSDEELNRAVEVELRRLSYVAFAMFNRGTQWVTQGELSRDLVALLGENIGTGQDRAGLRRQLSDAEIAIGRFFFIHRARAQQAEKRIETYEFLHATFAEYLVARMVGKLVRVLAAREAAAEEFFDRSAPDDNMLRALLSFAPLSTRAPIIKFFAEIMASLSDAERRAIGDVLIRLFRTANHRRIDRGHDGYTPRSASIPKRHANYSANLVITIVAVLGHVRVSQLYGQKRAAIGLWQADTLLWRSQIEYYSIMLALYWERTWTGEERDIILRLASNVRAMPKVHPEWSHLQELVSGGDSYLSILYSDVTLMRRQNFFASSGDDVLAHAIEPLVAYLPGSLTKFMNIDGEFRSISNLILETMLHPSVGAEIEQREKMYGWCAHALVDLYGASSSVGRKCANLIVARLLADVQISASRVAHIFMTLGVDFIDPSLAVSCILRFIGRAGGGDDFLIATLGHFLHRMRGSAEILELEVEVYLRTAELEVHQLHWSELEWREKLRELAESGRRPDLVQRGEWMLSHRYGQAAED
jgi:hypothetical protein